jgi:hypothetical protein
MSEIGGESASKKGRWYCSINARRKGPYTFEELLEKLPHVEGLDTWIKGPGVLRWKRARDVEVFGQDDDVESTPPNPAFWLTYLFFKPSVFYRTFVIRRTPALTLLCAWIYGMVGAIDRMDSRALAGKALPFGESWIAYWIAVTVVGVFGGLFYFFIGGWWYRMRPGYSGVIDPDKGLARRVYLFASQILAVPVVLMTALETSNYSSPLEAAASPGSPWHSIFLIFPFWSVWSSYIGVRTAFPVKYKGPDGAKLWFLILPCVFYLFLLYMIIQAS